MLPPNPNKEYARYFKTTFIGGLFLWYTGDMNDRQRAFAEKYIELHMNGVQAYMEVYGIDDYNVAGASASRLLKNVKIRAYINDRLKAMAIGADEVLHLVREQATGTIRDFLDDDDNLDLAKARRLNKLHLIKKYEKTKDGVKIELYPADSAQDKLMRYHSLYNDKIEHAWRDKVPVDKQELIEQFFKTAVRVAKSQIDD